LGDIFRVLAVAWARHRVRLKRVFWAFHQLASVVNLFELLKPIKVHNLLKRWSFCSVFLKHGLARSLAFLTYLVPGTKVEVRRILNSLPCNFAVIFVVKGKHTTKEKVGDDTKRPNVNFLAIRFLTQDLRRNIGQSAERISAAFAWSYDLA
jgi:hypothetical protein